MPHTPEPSGNARAGGQRGADSRGEELTGARVHLLRLRRSRPTPFRLQPDAAARKALAQEMGLLSLSRLRLSGRLIPRGQLDWELQAELGASVVQPCVVTLAPVRSRIDVPVARLYLAAHVEPMAAESEIPEDDRVEPLPDSLDLAALMREELALALPLYPRAAGAPAAGTAQVYGAEEAPSPEAERKVLPFAALAGLRGAADETGADDGAGSDDMDAGDENGGSGRPA